MRTHVAVLVLLLTLAATASAMSRKEMIDLHTNRLVPPLQLNESQADSVREVITRSLGKLQQLGGDPRKAMGSYRDLDASVRKQISAHLSDEQRSMLDNLQGSVLPDPQMFALNDRLDLTPSQYEQIERIRLSYREKMQQSRGGDPGDREANRAQMEKIKAQQDSEIMALLSEAQRTEYEHLRQEQQEQRRPPTDRPRDGGGGGGGGGPRF